MFRLNSNTFILKISWSFWHWMIDRISKGLCWAHHGCYSSKWARLWRKMKVVNCPQIKTEIKHVWASSQLNRRHSPPYWVSIPIHYFLEWICYLFEILIDNEYDNNFASQNINETRSSWTLFDTFVINSSVTTDHNVSSTEFLSEEKWVIHWKY